MIRRPPRSTHCISSAALSSAASDVYKRQSHIRGTFNSFSSRQYCQELPHHCGSVHTLSLIHISEPTRLDVI
eukprot:1101671-Prorocentrum_lima.AAC.1